MFPGAAAPYIEADTTRNALIVKGTREQVADVKAALAAIGGNAGAGSGNVRIITLNQGSARTLAEAIERILPQMRQNPVQVITPGSEPAKSEPARRSPATVEGQGEDGHPVRLHQQRADPGRSASQEGGPAGPKGHRPSPSRRSAIG